MAYTDSLIENITYTMQIPYCGCFDWTAWLFMLILLIGWMAFLYVAERRKDVVFAFISIFFGLGLLANDLARDIFVIATYPLAIIFVIVSIYEFYIIVYKR
jgi:asparagine N-glycosylation enzyme membrane subunit Stt3